MHKEKAISPPPQTITHNTLSYNSPDAGLDLDLDSLAVAGLSPDDAGRCGARGAADWGRRRPRRRPEEGEVAARSAAALPSPPPRIKDWLKEEKRECEPRVRRRFLRVGRSQTHTLHGLARSPCPPLLI